MRQIASEPPAHFEQETARDDQGHEKVYVTVRGKRKVLCHIYSLEQWERLYNQFRIELSQAGELIPLPRIVLGCPQCGDLPAGHNGLGQVVCHHVRDGIEKAYRRNEFGDIVGYLTFNQ